LPEIVRAASRWSSARRRSPITFPVVSVTAVKTPPTRLVSSRIGL
jgi:hypothetical protein